MFTSSMKRLQQAGGNTLLIGMPHKQAHAPLAVIKELGMMATAALSSRTDV